MRLVTTRLTLELLEDRAVPTVYGVTDLGVLGGEYSEGYSINSAGQVAGISETSEIDPEFGAVAHGFLWDRGGMTDLGTLGGEFAAALGINDRGQVVGSANNTELDPFAPGTQIGHAFLWNRGTMTDLGVLPSTVNSEAWAVNNSGTAVGWSFNLYPDFINRITSPPNGGAFVWDHGKMSELVLPSGFKNPFAGAINDHGDIAGNAADSATLHAIVWHKDRRGVYVPVDLGFPPDHFRSSLRGINDDGDVVGDARKSGSGSHAFWWKSDGHGNYAPVDLGTLGGFGSGALDINEHDQIVGRSSIAGGEQHAFLYDHGSMRDLNDLILDPSWELIAARSINDRGQIVGLGIHNDQFHAFRLEPRDDHDGRRILVHSGESIQAAVNLASPGAIVQIEPGTYAEPITVTKPDIHLIGLRGPHGEGVVIVNPDDEEDGIKVTPAGAGFELRNVNVRGFEENGVLLIGVDRFLLSHVTAIDNGEYGLFPVNSSHGVIEHCTASGHADTGLYIGQSHNVVIRNSTAFGNVIGIDVENSSNIRITHCESFDNTAGIIVMLLPGLPVTTSAGLLIDHNNVHDNNHANFGEPGEIESFVPVGTGIVALGADRATIRNNRVTGNRFVGIGVGSSLLLTVIAGLPPSAFAGIEPNADSARVLDNWAIGNGTGPSAPGLLPADLLWDGTGNDNVWSGNSFATSVPGALPGRRRGH